MLHVEKLCVCFESIHTLILFPWKPLSFEKFSFSISFIIILIVTFGSNLSRAPSSIKVECHFEKKNLYFVHVSFMLTVLL